MERKIKSANEYRMYRYAKSPEEGRIVLRPRLNYDYTNYFNVSKQIANEAYKKTVFSLEESSRQSLAETF